MKNNKKSLLIFIFILKKKLLMSRERLIANLSNYFAYLLLALLLAFIVYFAYNSYYLSENRFSIQWDENLLSMTWDVTIEDEEDMSYVESRIDELESQSQHSKEEIFELSLYYSDLWKIWKAIVVLENYLDLDEWDFEENSYIYRQLGFLYEEICSEDNIEYCKSALRYMVDMYENWAEKEYLLNIWNVLWTMWEEERANILWEHYEDLPEHQKQDPEESNLDESWESWEEVELSPEDIWVEIEWEDW